MVSEGDRARCIEEQIAYHAECIRHLGEERNSLQPISRLPPEILGTVFCFVLAGQTVPFPFPTYYFTHVSRSWRFVALNMPSLWRVIRPVGSRCQWTNAALERSKAADLILLSKFRSGYQSSDSPASLSILKLVLTKHASRVREIDIDLAQFTFPALAAVFGDIQQSSLRLHSLELDSHVSRGYIFPTGVVETDSLRRLEIRNCNGPWYSMSFPALTTLKLHRIANRPPLNEFLELLRGLATLQVLDMENSLPFARDPDHSSGPIGPIHLPGLQCLRLSTTKDLKEVSNILSHITVPPTATLRFVVIIGRSTNIMASTFSAFFSRMGQSLSYSILHILSVTSSSFCLSTPQSSGCNALHDMPLAHLHLRAWNDDDGSASSFTPNLEVVFALKGHPTEPITAQRVVRRIFPSLPLFDITTLTLEITPVGELLRHTMSDLPHLRSVTVVGFCAAKFIRELTMRHKNYDDRQLSDYCSVIFPALEFLWIRKGSFSAGGPCEVEGLQDCLMERYERKAEVLKLKLTCCRGLFRSSVKKLREIVVDVEWDEAFT